MNKRLEELIKLNDLKEEEKQILLGERRKIFEVSYPYYLIDYNFRDIFISAIDENLSLINHSIEMIRVELEKEGLRCI